MADTEGIAKYKISQGTPLLLGAVSNRCSNCGCSKSQHTPHRGCVTIMMGKLTEEDRKKGLMFSKSKCSCMGFHDEKGVIHSGTAREMEGVFIYDFSKVCEK